MTIRPAVVIFAWLFCLLIGLAGTAACSNPFQVDQTTAASPGVTFTPSTMVVPSASQPWDPPMPTATVPSPTPSGILFRYLKSYGGVLREKPDEESEILDYLVRGDRVELLWIQGDWAYVRFEGKSGYIYKYNLSPQMTP